MVKMKASCLGDYLIECTHESGTRISTDLPKEIGGQARAFAPTDLFALSLATCMMTSMEMAAKKIGFELKDCSAEIEKEMGSSPRRVGRVVVRIRSSHTPSPQVQEKLEQAALHCPVHRSFHPDVKVEIDFVWGL